MILPQSEHHFFISFLQIICCVLIFHEYSGTIVNSLETTSENEALLQQVGSSLKRLLGFDWEEFGNLTISFDALYEMTKHDRHFGALSTCTEPTSCLLEAYARLHVLSSRAGVLPVGSSPWFRFHDSHARCFEEFQCDDIKLRQHIEDLHPQTSKYVPQAHHMSIDRHQIAYFLEKVSKLLSLGTATSRCLEWDNTFYSSSVLNDLCTFKNIFNFTQKGKNKIASASADDGNEKTFIYSTDIVFEGRDIEGRRKLILQQEDGMKEKQNLESLDYILPDEHFDVVIFEQVIEHVSHPHDAMAALYRILKPGGLVLWGAPFFAVHHPIPTDYFRYTVQGAELLATVAGFKIEMMYAPGDVSLLSGMIQGLQPDYWKPEEMLQEAKERWGLWNMQTHMLLSKPRQKID
mmetsp:Transcript_6442/g.8507  ORF Transcript_6442/g.8507 Transcript_6442/m.8507 type:complete len:405 (-) Transcript_6442:187-1401(-)